MIVVQQIGIPCVSLRHRHHGPLVYVDMRLEVDGELSAKNLVEVGNRKRSKDIDGTKRQEFTYGPLSRYP